MGLLNSAKQMLAMPASVHALPNLVPILTPPSDALQIMHS